MILDPLKQGQVAIVLTFRFQSTPGYDQVLVLAWHGANGLWGHMSTTYHQGDVQFLTVVAWLREGSSEIKSGSGDGASLQGKVGGLKIRPMPLSRA